MSSLLALLSAVPYGSADFLGGLASRRTTALTVVVVSQSYGLSLLVLLLPLLPPDRYGWPNLLWGAAAGVAEGVGLLFPYRGLAIRRMGAVAPVSAVVGAVIPAVFGLLVGEGDRPAGDHPGHRYGRHNRDQAAEEPRVSGGSGGRNRVRWLLHPRHLRRRVQRAAAAARSQAGSLAVLGLVLLSRGRRLPSGRGPIGRSSGRESWTSVPTRFLHATRGGLLTLVAILASLYPAITVVLARLILGERLQRTQVVGVLLALLGVGMITGG